MPAFDCGDPDCGTCRSYFGPDRAKAIAARDRRKSTLTGPAGGGKVENMSGAPHDVRSFDDLCRELEYDLSLLHSQWILRLDCMRCDNPYTVLGDTALQSAHRHIEGLAAKIFNLRCERASLARTDERGQSASNDGEPSNDH